MSDFDLNFNRVVALIPASKSKLRKIKKRIGIIMFGHHVAVLYNKIELEFAVGGIGEAPF